MTGPVIARCGGCGTQLAPSLLRCPMCRRLSRQAEIQAHARTAEAQAESPELALRSWRDALELVPADDPLHAEITGKIEALVAASPQAEASAQARSPIGRALLPLGALGALLWKAKVVIAFVLTKGKLLFLGLTKATTLLSVLLSLGVYWTAWGWQLAAALLACIYVHELGHVFALQRLGYAADAPTFVPGLGAYVRLRHKPASVAEDARIGLAGPTWGLGVSVVCWLIGVVWDAPFATALAHVNAWINLFNLLPVWQLDGGRGFRALSRAGRWAVAGLAGAVWLGVGDGMLLLLALVSAMRALGPSPQSSHRPSLLRFGLLTAGLALFTGLGGGLSTSSAPGTAPVRAGQSAAQVQVDAPSAAPAP